MNTKSIALVSVLVVIVGLGSFYGGTQYTGVRGGWAGRDMADSGQVGKMRMGQGSTRMRGGVGIGGTVGEIFSKDEVSVTIKLPDGGSRIVFYTGSTTVMKSVASSPSDLSIGERVFVSGEANSDGSINARSIQVGGVELFGQRSFASSTAR